MTSPKSAAENYYTKGTLTIMLALYLTIGESVECAHLRDQSSVPVSGIEPANQQRYSKEFISSFPLDSNDYKLVWPIEESQKTTGVSVDARTGEPETVELAGAQQSGQTSQESELASKGALGGELWKDLSYLNQPGFKPVQVNLERPVETVMVLKGLATKIAGSLFDELRRKYPDESSQHIIDGLDVLEPFRVF